MTDHVETTTAKLGETDDGPTCTLPTGAMAERADWIRETVEPHLLEVTEGDERLTFRFERSDGVYEAVSDLLWNEADCCAFATHELSVPAEGDWIEWHWRTDGAGIEVLREASEQFDALEVPSER